MFENEINDLSDKLKPNYGMLIDDIIINMVTFNKDKR